jgi:hypothetical protein
MLIHHDIIHELLKRGATVLLELRGNTIAYRVPGFYQAKQVVLFDTDEPGQMVCLVQNDNRLLTYIDDLVQINFELWMKSRQILKDWASPSPVFIRDFERLGLIEIETQHKYIPRTNETNKDDL